MGNRQFCRIGMIVVVDVLQCPKDGECIPYIPYIIAQIRKAMLTSRVKIGFLGQADLADSMLQRCMHAAPMLHTCYPYQSNDYICFINYFF